jgi:transposase
MVMPRSALPDANLQACPPPVAEPFARRRRRVSNLARLLTHAAGGRPAERLMARLGLRQSDDTLRQSLKRHAAGRNEKAQVRVVGIDDWDWRKGMSYGTILVDLERREVLDVLVDRSAGVTARWLAGHPEIEVVNRDRAGLYAHCVRQFAFNWRQDAAAVRKAIIEIWSNGQTEGQINRLKAL